MQRLLGECVNLGDAALRQVLLVDIRFFDGFEPRAHQQHRVRRDHHGERRIDLRSGHRTVRARNQ